MSIEEMSFSERTMGNDYVWCDGEGCPTVIENIKLPKNRQIFEDNWTTEKPGLSLPMNYCPSCTKKRK